MKPIHNDDVRRRSGLITTAIFFIVAFFTAGNAATHAQTMSNGSYCPGCVLAWRDGELRVARRSDVHPGVNYYVLVHGANGKSRNDNLLKLAQTIHETDPDGDIFFIDWSYWGDYRVTWQAIIEEQAKWLVVQLAIVGFGDLITSFNGDSDAVTSEHYAAVITANIAIALGRVAMNVLPVEQTLYIPEVADRSYRILFDSDLTTWSFETDGQTSKFEALGLDPARTHIIGHSHGCHVAGMICKYVAQNKDSRVSLRSEAVKRLTALDPSFGEMHISSENQGGQGWDANVAKFVDVYRLSELCCGDRLYGDFNLRVAVPNPTEKYSRGDVSDSTHAMAYLTERVKFDASLHTATVGYFRTLVPKKNFLKAESFQDVWNNPSDRGRWIVIAPN